MLPAKFREIEYYKEIIRLVSWIRTMPFLSGFGQSLDGSVGTFFSLVNTLFNIKPGIWALTLRRLVFERPEKFSSPCRSTDGKKIPAAQNPHDIKP